MRVLSREVIDCRLQEASLHGRAKGTTGGRQLAHMIYGYFKICGTSEALLDDNDLLRVQFKNDNVQGFDTKWDEVLLSMTKGPGEDILQTVYKKLLLYLKELTPILWYHRRKNLGVIIDGKKCFVGIWNRKLRDRNFNAHCEDGSLQGSAAWKENPRGNPKNAMEKKRAKTDKMEIVVHGPRQASVRQEMGQKFPLFFRSEKTLDTGYTKGIGPQGTACTVRQESQGCYHFQKERCQKGIQNAHT